MRIATRYLPSEIALSPELIDDVAGELANVIAGQAKTMLKGTPHHFLLSTPCVTRRERRAGEDAASQPAGATVFSELGAWRWFVELPASEG